MPGRDQSGYREHMRELRAFLCGDLFEEVCQRRDDRTGIRGHVTPPERTKLLVHAGTPHRREHYHEDCDDGCPGKSVLVKVRVALDDPGGGRR